MHGCSVDVSGDAQVRIQHIISPASPGWLEAGACVAKMVSFSWFSIARDCSFGRHFQQALSNLQPSVPLEEPCLNAFSRNSVGDGRPTPCLSMSPVETASARICSAMSSCVRSIRTPRANDGLLPPDLPQSTGQEKRTCTACLQSFTRRSRVFETISDAVEAECEAR